MPGVCPRCLREVYFAEEKLALGKVWHTFCFSCRNCRKLLDSCTVATHCGELFCRNCCTRLFAPSVQPPSSPQTLNLTIEDRGPPFTSRRAPVSACDSVSDCYCCCCCPEDFSTGEVHPDVRGSPLEKPRLRGGGGEEEETEEFRLGGETRRCSESDCSNLGIVSSVTTLCNAPSSPTAVTTWYNRQHSASQSTFGGQTSTKRPSARAISTPSPGTLATNLRSNNIDRLNSGSNCGNGGHKCSVVRRPGSPCRPLINQIRKPPHREKEQQFKQFQQPQQLQLQSEQHQSLQSQVPLQQSQLQHPQKQQHQQESSQDQLQQHVKSINFNRNNKNNFHQTSLRYLPTKPVPLHIMEGEMKVAGKLGVSSLSEEYISPRAHLSADKISSYETDRIGANISTFRGKLATGTPSSHPTTVYRHVQFPRRRVSFRSDIPKEPNATAEISTCRMKMPNENNNYNNNFYGNVTSASGTTTSSNNPNNYTISNPSCNGTPYETCYEMDDPNVPGYSTGISAPNCSPGAFEDGEHQPVNFDHEEDSRLRGGCGGCGGGGGSGRSGGCGCGGGGCGGSGGCGGCPTTQIIQPCPPRDECREPTNPCSAPSCDPPCGIRSRCCSPAGYRPVCKKPTRTCCPPCTAEPQGCGIGGCCGSGCRGGCGKPGRLCMPLRPCSTPPCQPQVCRPRGSPCMPPRCCAPTPPCCKPPGVTSRPSCGVGGGGSCCRSKSPRRGCCSYPQDDGVCGYCGPKLPPGCECLGGGLDCQRCGRKVYQAEMQIASGVPYHNICFSCFCCRKPLEPLTYQENCGEIYCKQCYVRNFGPQGYGYGAGAGVLQTPL